MDPDGWGRRGRRDWQTFVVECDRRETNKKQEDER